ncbi:hypothetical protein CIPAW_14G006400 [Carya illinoinensis]|uniref:Disease resistance RPP13-like protein 1 n=1 Tax=Carya illinoinensis TaxID=32201 RepID=A0A8T1NF78_CARIL|nr:hypothetical protein CIPAW_14G006400 [Carya illinoinensis]
MAKVGLAFLSAILGVVFDKVVSPKVVDFMQGRKLTEGLLRKLKTTVLSVNAVLEDAEEKEHTKPFVRDWIDELKDTLYDAEDILDEIATKALRCKLDAEFQTTTGKVRNSISAFLNPFIHHLEPKIQETTLAQLVYNDSRVKRHFDLKIWFRVSEEFDEIKVEKSIIEAATSTPFTLKKNLNGKKFLLVLDDVWSEKPIHQELLGQLLHYGAQGSKILITTRNEKVALAMHAIATHHHHLKLLPQDVCWSLFEKHAFLNGSSSNTDPKIREIGPQIVEKCKGLPLAIKAIGDLLWSESDVKKWMNILKSDLWDLPPEKTTILPALRLSYKYLPSDLKHCFAYCSIFPKDYIFEKDQLVLLWMVEGFLQQFVIETMEEVGNRYFDALVSRSLFQQSLKTNSGFVMHDLVNDLAKFMTGQFGFTRLKGDSSKEIGKMTRYLLYFGRNSGNFKKNEEDLYKAKQLRTFLALDCNAWSEIKMPKTCVTKLPDSISKMKHLRYLDVSSTAINRLPNSICMLCNLQTLKLSKCYNLDRLPRDMWKLINLRHLEIDGTRKLKEMPIQMGKLKCLQTLSNFILSKHSGSCIGELGKLINLQGKLLIQKLEYVRSAYDALDASLKDKGYLEDPIKNLKSLTINYYGGKEFPNCMPRLPSLSKLKLIDCKYCCALPPIRQLHSLFIDFQVLTHMEIIGCDNLQSLEGLRAPNLAHFILNNCKSLRSMPAKMHLFLPSLCYMELSNCPEVKSFPEGGLPVGQLPLLSIDFPVLTHIEIIGCDNLQSLEGLRAPNLARFILNNCKSLRSMPEKMQLFLPSLHYLELRNCPEVKLFPEGGLAGGQLPSLSIDFSVLTHMEIIGCDSLQSLEGLRAPNLARFILNNCKSLKSMPDNMHLFLPSLCYLELRNCPEVKSFPERGLLVGQLPSLSIDFPVLTHMEIIMCDNLQSLEGLRAPNLSCFILNNCKSLRSMPDKMHLFLPSLRYLELKNCPEVKSFPDRGLPVGQLPLFSINFLVLTHMEIIGCDNLQSLEGLRAPNLALFILNNCKSLRLMPDKMHLFFPSLCYLKLVKCLEVESFPEKGLPSNLELLLPTTLTNLKIHSLEMKSLDKEGFQHLTSLVQLEIWNCPKLKYMPEEGFPTSLCILEIWNCNPALEKELKGKKGKEWLKVARIPNIAIDNDHIQGDEWVGESPMQPQRF